MRTLPRLSIIVCLLLIVMTTMTTQSDDDATKINTDGWTDSPFMTLDGRYLYFMYTPYNFFPWIFENALPEKRGPDRAGHHPDLNGNAWGDSDIYRVERLPDGTWSAPLNLPFNDDGADACGMLSADGTAFYWQKGTVSADIYVVYRDEDKDGEWGEPERLPEPINLDTSHETNPHISTDHQTLYFTSDREGGYGGNDLYVATRAADGRWSEPQNLGDIINTDQGDDQFWVSEDGRRAYFNRDLTLMVMQRVDDGWSTPEVVQFVGGAVSGAEASFTRDGKTMILAVPDIFAQRLELIEYTLQPNGHWGDPRPLD